MRKTLDILHRLEDGTLILALVAMLLMALMQIVLRNLLDTGFLWAESFLRILVLWVAMLGAMVATRERHHISIDLLSRLMPVTWHRGLVVITSVFSAAVCFAATWYCVEYIQYEYEDQTVAFSIGDMDVRVWVCQSILPAGFGVIGLRFLTWPFRPLNGNTA